MITQLQPQGTYFSAGRLEAHVAALHCRGRSIRVQDFDNRVRGFVVDRELDLVSTPRAGRAVGGEDVLVGLLNTQHKHAWS